MGLFSRLMDKREKMDYATGCGFIFDALTFQAVGFTKEYSALSEQVYRFDLVGVVAAYLDTKSPQKSPFGADMIRYGGRGYGQMLVAEPSAVEKESDMKLFQEKYAYYSNFSTTQFANNFTVDNIKALAAEICRMHQIEPSAEHINSVVTDIQKMIQFAEAVLSAYRFV